MRLSLPLWTILALVTAAVCLSTLMSSGLPAWQVLVFVEAEVDGSGGVNSLEQPFFVAMSPDGKHVYAASSFEDAVTVFSRNMSTGELAYASEVKDTDPGVDGLAAPTAIAVSPDGHHVYVSSSEDDAVSVFSRNSSTGALTWVEVEIEGVGGVYGLNGAWSVTVSPDGSHVYTGAFNSDAVALFSRNPTTGELTHVTAYYDGSGGVDGLNGTRCVTVSPDGRHVYAAASVDNSVAVFARNSSTGELTFVEVEKDGSAGVDGLATAWAVALSPDGGDAYATGPEVDGLAIFARDPATGELTFKKALFDDAGGIDGMHGPRGLTVSPDGQHLYVAGALDNAVAVFARNPSTGALTWAEQARDGVAGVDGIGGAQAIAVSPNGDHVYVAGHSDDAVAAFESQGPAAQEQPPAFITAWGSGGAGQGEFDSPSGAAAGSLYVADRANHRIQKFDEAGSFITEWGSQGSTSGSFDNPFDVTADTLGQVFVLDYGNDRVQVFDSTGGYLRQWGGSGSASGELNSPRSIAVGFASVTYVADTGNHRIQRFAPAGTVLGEWGSSGRGAGSFVIAEGVAVGPGEDVYVTDYSLTERHHRIQRFDSSGTVLGAWGAGPSSANGRLNLPGRPGVDGEGNVYVPDILNDRILKFDKDGRFLTTWGTTGTGDGEFDGPVAVAVDSIGRIYVVDRDNERIQVFGGPWLDLFIGETTRPEKSLWLTPTAPPNGPR